MAAYASEELNCEDIQVRNASGESVRIEFRRKDLYSPLSLNTEVLAMGSPDNPHWRQLGVASFYMKSFTLLDKENINSDLSQEIYGVKLKAEGYLVQALKLTSNYVYGICTKTIYTGEDM